MKINKASIRIATGLFVAGTILTSTVAFELLSPPRKWFTGAGGDTPVSLLVYTGGESSVGDADNGVQAVKDASEEWENHVSVNLLAMGNTSQNTIGQDGQNTVSFEDPGKIVRRAIAVTITGWYDGGQTESTNGIDFVRIDESDISFSKQLDFTTQAVGNCSGEYDIKAVMTHEVGHFLGLGHSGDAGALMAPSISSCSFKPLNNDDIDGINTIYTDGYSGGPGNGCTATELRLTTHTASAPNKGKNCLEITIGAVDDCGNAAAGASITVQLAGNTGDVLTGTAAAGADGSVTFALACKDAASSSYTSTVLSINGSAPWSSSDPDNTADVSILAVPR
ncbi:MAG: hypothetical protein ACI89L_001483 [Phycisphaerales bacterium]|jgi:hypothetical protein